MQNITPNTYERLIEEASRHVHYSKPEMEILINDLKDQSLRLNAQSPLFYAVDYTQQKYIYIDPSCNKILGYDFKYIENEGPLLYLNLLHKNDKKIFTENIIPETLDFLSRHDYKEHSSFSFSLNYRIKKDNGDYITLLQRSTYYLSSAEPKPLAAVGYATDISDYKQDTSIIHTIEKTNRNSSVFSKTVMQKTVYYPDRYTGIFSKREMEILQLIHNGLSSKQIAAQLYLSVYTVNNHRKKMMQKSGSANVAELMAFALKTGII